MIDIPFWSLPAAQQVDASTNGLSSDAAARRLQQYGPNALHERRRSDVPTVLLRQFASPIVLLLIGAMTLLGLLVLHNPVKTGVERTIQALRDLGVSLKMITGDNALVAQQIARRVGMRAPVMLTGQDLRTIADDALPVRSAAADVFAEIEPNQKERVIRALRTAGHVVGYMGDGINDAPALHAADVSISVQDAADVAKGAADIVLLQQDLSVLEAGVREGRKTFANTFKYVFMATSANFGNMLSMAGASLRPSRTLVLATVASVGVTIALPFLPVAALPGFARMPVMFGALMAGIVLVYVASAETAKRRFYRRLRE